MKTNIVKNVKAGFSLVEMLVVIAVIGIIAAIAVPTIGNITEQANTAKAQRNAQNLASVCASAVAAGANEDGTDWTDEATAVALLTGVGVNGAGNFDETFFRVPNLAGDDRTDATAYLDYDDSVGMLVYNSELPAAP